MNNEIKIVRTGIVRFQDISVKKYVLNNFAKYLGNGSQRELNQVSDEFLKKGLEFVYDKARGRGRMGLAFLYSYEDGQIVRGIDLQIYREIAPQATEMRFSNNPMIHSWTLEKKADSGFEELHSGDDGRICLAEQIIAGDEARYFRNLLSSFKNKDMIVPQYMKSFFRGI
ncbi:MAG: hypothetical protein ACP5N3_06060 [Candidatus Nanoarchaeia archaeon]